MNRYRTKARRRIWSSRILSGALLAALAAMACGSFPNPQFPYVEYYRQLPEYASAGWLIAKQVSVEPLVAGAVHTPVALSALPTRFREQYPAAMTYAPLWARERDTAVFLRDELAAALARRLELRSSKIAVPARPGTAAAQFQYHASAHLGLGQFKAVLFGSRAGHLGDNSSDEQFAPFRKAFLVSTEPTSSLRMRLVTGYLRLHCAHELVGRGNRDRASTSIDWLVGLADPEGRVVAQAYVGASSVQWECPVEGAEWQDLLDALADRVILAIIMPER
jgi:hypothetical protein